MGDLFDSPWKILIIAALVLILFGARKMPDAARSLGRSMRILKAEVSGLHDDDEPQPAASQPPQLIATPDPASAQQIEQLQQQVRDLQQQQASNAGSASAAEPQHTQPL
jgi:sec-independent protein translocase protein TatA